MKSLEYVKKIREDLNQCFRHWNPATMNNDNDFYYNEWETIKQDLEVLEILRKHLWVEDDYVCLSDYLNNNYYEEHFHKVKQWLEENE